MAVITHRDIAEVFALDLTQSEADAIDNVWVPDFTSILEAAFNRSVEQRVITGEEHWLDPSTFQSPTGAVNPGWLIGAEVWLQDSPVASIQRVRIDDQLGNARDLAASEWDRIRRRLRLYLVPGIRPAIVTVDYTAGLTAAHSGYGGVRVALLARTYRALVHRRGAANADKGPDAGVKSLSVEGYSVTYDDNIAAIVTPGFTDAELAPCSSLTRRVLR